MFSTILFRPDLWGRLQCDHCAKKYDKEWYRENDLGMPLYNRREKVNPLSMEELQKVINDEITVEWFCSPVCSNEATRPLKEKNDSSSIPDSKT